MKTKITSMNTACRAIVVATVFLFAMLHSAMAQPADVTWILPFSGTLADHEGIVGWDADGSGPEPFGEGHQVPIFGYTNMPYYGASRDYGDIDPDPMAAAAHLTGFIQGFPLFVQALADNGFTPAQVQFKVDLGDLGADVEGSDWFVINGTVPHSFYYEQPFYLLCAGEKVIGGQTTFNDVFCTWTWRFETSYFKLDSAWAADADPAIRSVGIAFLKDIGDEEIRLVANMGFQEDWVDENGRAGMAYDITGQIEKGLPYLPYKGFAYEHQGMAGWNADTTAPEPAGDGHGAQRYYIASRDYGDIDPDPDAAFGHFWPDMKGFLNFNLQLQYRDIEPSRLLIKQGLASLGNDVMGLDWGFENGTNYWCNYYDLDYLIELDGEVIIRGLIDTSNSWMNADPVFWYCDATLDLPRDGSAQSSPDAQLIAAAFMKDMECRKMINDVQKLTYDTASFSGNGRYDGGYFNVESARLVFKNVPGCCFVQCDTLGGGMSNFTDWKLENSPYFIDNDVVIAEGQTLNIESGVKVAIRGPYNIKVNGRILAQGTEEEGILFTPSNPLQRWNSIIYDYTPDDWQSKFEYCTFEYGYNVNNIPFNTGGAFHVYGFSNILFNNCTFRYNQVEKFMAPIGGAIALKNANPVISHCKFYSNKAKYGGAIACFENADPVIEYCLFYGNHASNDGGAIWVYEYSYPTFINNTITGNDAGRRGGGVDIFHSTYDTVYFVNNIIYGNTCTDTTGQEISLSSENNHIDFQYNDIRYGLAGLGPGAHTYINYAENNIDEDPMFCFPEDWMFTLADVSPCLYSGMDGTYMGAYDMDCYVNLPEEPESDEVYSFFPNPATTMSVSVAFSLESSSPARLEIYNITGAKVAEPVNGYYTTGEHQVTFTIEGLPAGMYIGRLTACNKARTAKLVKMR